MSTESQARALALRERKKQALRHRIMRNALELFTLHGYDAVSIDAIVEASLCSRSTFHRYFGTKEDLLFPGVDEWLSVLAARLRSPEAAADPWVAARDASTHGIFGFIGSLDETLAPGIVRLWFSEPAPYRRYLEIVMAWEEELREFFGECLEVGGRDSLECRLLATTVSGALRAALTTALETGGDGLEAAQRSFDLVESGGALHDLVRPAAER